MNFKRFSISDNQWHDIPHYIHNTSTDTLTTLPAVLYPNAVTATVGLKGNMYQASGVSPTTPIQPSECGDMTENLFDKDSNTINNNGQIRPGVDVPAGIYSISNGTPNWVYYRVGVQGATRQISAGSNAENINASDTLYVWRDANIRQDGVMLNTGSTALPYEPYGYKLDISSGGTTTPVYLGEVETTRKIKKLVLTGEETYIADASYSRFITAFPNAKIEGVRLTQVFCTHFISVYDGRPISEVPNNSIYSSDVAVDRFFIKTTDYTSVADFKDYLRQQYAAGTPVTVWYVLATPETAVVNEPLRKIGEYADTVSGISIPTIAGANTLSVDTTLQPSEVTATYKGWHPVTDVHERDSGAWT